MSRISDNFVPQIDSGPDEATVPMPRLTFAPRGAAVRRWAVREGQRVAAGDVIAEIAAADTTLEIEAPADGVVAALLVPEGPEEIEAGRVIARIAPVAVAAIVAGDANAMAREPTWATPAVPDGAAHGAAAHGPGAMLTYVEALQAGLAEEMRRDERVFLIGESVADFGRSSGVARGLMEEFGGQRVVGVPITPEGFTGLAVGAAMAGLRPVVEFRGWSVALQAIDHIVSTAAKTRYRSGGALGVPIVLRGLNGAWPSTGPMHSVSFAAWFANVPGLKVVCPATPSCAKALLKAAIRDPDPVIMLETEALYDASEWVLEGEDRLAAIGKARIAREGRDLSIVTYGRGVMIAGQAAEQMAQSGVCVEVVDLRTLRPIDVATVLASVRKTGRLLTLDDGWPVCSIGAEICATVAVSAFDALRSPPGRVEAADVPVPYAANLEDLVFPSAADVAAKGLRVVGSVRSERV